MRLRVDPPELRDHLLEQLRASGCLAVKHGTNEVEAHLLNSVSERHDREALAAFLGKWQAALPQARLEITRR